MRQLVRFKTGKENYMAQFFDGVILLYNYATGDFYKQVNINDVMILKIV